MKNTLNISHIRIKKFDDDKGNFKAYVDITIAGGFMIHQLRILEGPEGLFLTMPSKKTRDGESYKDIAHPISLDIKNELEELVFAAYREAEKQEETTYSISLEAKSEVE